MIPILVTPCFSYLVGTTIHQNEYFSSFFSKFECQIESPCTGARYDTALYHISHSTAANTTATLITIVFLYCVVALRQSPTLIKGRTDTVQFYCSIIGTVGTGTNTLRKRNLIFAFAFNGLFIQNIIPKPRQRHFKAFTV